MQKMSLPSVLQFALQQHAAAADIDDDDELKDIMSNLTELNEKVEAIKHRARLKRMRRS